MSDQRAAIWGIEMNIFQVSVKLDADEEVQIKGIVLHMMSSCAYIAAVGIRSGTEYLGLTAFLFNNNPKKCRGFGAIFPSSGENSDCKSAAERSCAASRGLCLSRRCDMWFLTGDGDRYNPHWSLKTARLS